MTKIKIAKETDRQMWDNYVLAHPDGIAYQLYAWKLAVENAYGFKGHYLMAVKESKITGILPLIHVKVPLCSSSLISLPYCDAGGPLADTEDVQRQLIKKAVSISKGLGVKKVVIRSTKPMAKIDPELTENQLKVRMILALPKTSKDLFASFKSKLRSQVKKPIRDGLTLESGGIEKLDDFYSIFCENMRDLGSPVHSKCWIENILLKYQNRSRLFIVKLPDSTPAAGGILLCHNQIVSIPWASSLRRFNRMNPNMLLYWGFLEYAADNGFASFDFGRSTPDEGTFRFKKQWGAIPDALHWTAFTTAENSGQDLVPEKKQEVNDSTSRLRKIAETMVKKMPVSAASGLGNMFRKYITL